MNRLFCGLVKNRAHLLLAGFACYLLFGLFHPFLHNHVVDGHLYDDCEACLWVVVSAAIFILFIGLCLLLKVLCRCRSSCRPVFIPGIDFPPPSRSPPIS